MQSIVRARRPIRRRTSSLQQSQKARPTYATNRSACQSWLALVLSILLYFIRATPQSPSSTPQLNRALALPRAVAPPTLHIFTAPKPFVGRDHVHQLAALQSWQALQPRPIITLLGDDVGYDDMARRLGLRRIREIDTNFLGVPLLNSLLAATNSSEASISVLLNADVQLHDDFPYALRKIARDFPASWLAVGARWDIASLERNETENGGGMDAATYARTHGVLHTYGGIDVWAWDAASGPLIDSYVPHFVYGRGKYDNWITHEVLRERKRVVVDISEACTFVHVRHDHHLVSYGTEPGDEAPATRLQFWSSEARGKFELYLNSYLAATHGSYRNQDGTILHAPLKVSSCYEKEGLCIVHRKRPHSCRCEYSPFVAGAQNDPYVVKDSRVIVCGLLSENVGTERADGRERWAISGHIKTGSEERFGLPLTREHILKVIRTRTSGDRILTVVAAYEDRWLLMELVCSMRLMGVFRWLLVVALDDDVYRFALVRGLAVYLNSCSDEHCKDTVRYETISDLLKRGKSVYSVEIGSRLERSPWGSLAGALDGAVDIAVPVRWTATRDGRGLVPGIVYARPSTRAVALLEDAVRELRKRRLADLDGVIGERLRCGSNGLDARRRCRTRNGGVLYVWHGYIVDATVRFASGSDAFVESRYNTTSGVCMYGRWR